MKRSISFILSLITVFCLLFSSVGVKAATNQASAGVVSTTSSGLNVRKSPSTGAAILKSLKKGSYITLLRKSGDWWYVAYGKGLYGYCHSDYIRKVSDTNGIVNTQYSALNVRAGAGTNYGKIDSLWKGEQVVILSSHNDWSRILYHGTKTGYVSTQYLKRGSAAITLAVPDFKQTDSRWGNLELANSGKTFAQIGCSTTGIAMMESYRTGTTIYPNVMATKLRYTSTGSVYWPGHFTTITSSADYLTRIYELLKSGKPVLFGAKNASGKQHWVVINGYTGSGELTPSAFTVLDPGSNSRTNLQQFLNAYPVFYKYFHY